MFVNVDAGRAAAGRHARRRCPSIARERGLDLGALAFHHRVHYGVDANWKVAVENYLECYHCAVAHPAFSDVVDVRPDAYELERHPSFARHFAPARDGAGAGQFHLVWPALKVNVMPGDPNLSIGPQWPVSPSRTEGFLDYFFAPDARPGGSRSSSRWTTRWARRTSMLVASVQRGHGLGRVRARAAAAPGASR